MLIEAGLHPDFPDARNITPLDILHAYNNEDLQLMLSLKCLATSALLKACKNVFDVSKVGPDILPKNMIDYMDMHTRYQ